MKLTDKQDNIIASMIKTREWVLRDLMSKPQYGEWSEDFERIWEDQRQEAFDMLKIQLGNLSTEENNAIWMELKRQFEEIKKRLQKA